MLHGNFESGTIRPAATEISAVAMHDVTDHHLGNEAQNIEWPHLSLPYDYSHTVTILFIYIYEEYENNALSICCLHELCPPRTLSSSSTPEPLRYIVLQL